MYTRCKWLLILGLFLATEAHADSSVTRSLRIKAPIAQSTANSVLFVGADLNLSQDNAGFNYSPGPHNLLVTGSLTGQNVLAWDGINQSNVYAYDTTLTKAITMRHDGSNGILGTLAGSGDIQILPPVTNAITLGRRTTMTDILSTDGSSVNANWYVAVASAAAGAGNFSQFAGSIAANRTALASDNVFYADCEANYCWGAHLNMGSSGANETGLILGVHGNSGRGLLSKVDVVGGVNEDHYNYNVAMTGDMVRFKGEEDPLNANTFAGTFTGNYLAGYVRDVNKFKMRYNGQLELGGNNGVSISSDANGVITLGGIGNTNNENIKMGFEATANQVTLTSGSGVTIWQYNTFNVRQLDDLNFILGNVSDFEMQWDTAETNDSAKIGLVVGSANGSGNLLICELADINTNFNLPIESNPTLRIHSATATNLNQWIKFQHNATNPIIGYGQGNLTFTDINGNTSFALTSDASAVNNLTATGRNTAVSPDLVAVGSDTIVGITLTPKSTAPVKIGGRLLVAGHVHTSGSPPVISACGTLPTVSGDDVAFTVTTGATATGCTATFATAFTNSPHCTASPRTGSVVNTFSYTVSKTAVTVTETGLGGGLFDVVCMGDEAGT